MNQRTDYPYFLQNYSNLQNHFQEQFEELTPNDRGNIFADFVEKLIPYTKFGRDFEQPEQQKKSRDGGVDLIAEGKDKNKILFVQSKYSIKEKTDLDSIISKFSDYYSQKYGIVKNPDDMFDSFGIKVARKTKETIDIYFQIITFHDAQRIKRLYEDSGLLSLNFYRNLVETNRIEIVDGNEILQILRTNYRKSNSLPSEFELEFTSELLTQNNVHFGILSSNELTRLYEEHGDGLFFENVRDFLSSSEVNEGIVQTVKDEPGQFLERNNGVVFKASRVERISSNKLRLDKGSVINGCQTTISIVRNATNECFVLAKIVETSDENAWNITKSANFQNKIGRFDLELAQFLRPQIVNRTAANLGYSVSGNQSAIAILDVIHDEQIVYDELRNLFIGIFSNDPKNIFDTSYLELRQDVLGEFFSNSEKSEKLFDDLFTIFRASNNISSQIRERLAGEKGDTFRRFFKEDKTAYRAFFTLLAASSATEIDISKKIRDRMERYELIIEFLRKTVALIENHPKRFDQFYRETVKTVSATVRGREKKEIRQYLWSHFREVDFAVFLERIQQAIALANQLDN